MMERMMTIMMDNTYGNYDETYDGTLALKPLLKLWWKIRQETIMKNKTEHYNENYDETLGWKTIMETIMKIRMDNYDGNYDENSNGKLGCKL